MTHLTFKTKGLKNEEKIRIRLWDCL